MSKNDVDMNDPESIKIHIDTMRNSVGWQILLQVANLERESIIASGKAGRREEKTIKMWAVLDGFDRFFAIVNKLAKVNKTEEQNPELED